MTETKDLGNALYELYELFDDVEKKYEADCDMFWKNLSEEDKLKAFFSVCKRIYKGDVEDRRSYRGVLYDVFGFGSESYTIGMQCGYDDIHRLIQEGIHSKEIMKDRANSIREDYTKSGDQ